MDPSAAHSQSTHKPIPNIIVDLLDRRSLLKKPAQTTTAEIGTPAASAVQDIIDCALKLSGCIVNDTILDATIPRIAATPKIHEINLAPPSLDMSPHLLSTDPHPV